MIFLLEVHYISDCIQLCSGLCMCLERINSSLSHSVVSLTALFFFFFVKNLDKIDKINITHLKKVYLILERPV